MVKVEDPRFKHLKRKVAFFAAAALAVVAAVILLIGKENDLFTKKYELMLTVEKGTGFTRGMPVKLSGFRIGRVKSISLNEEARVDIVLLIDQKYQKWIRKDSTVKLVKEGLVGDSILEVAVGRSPDPLKDKERISFVKTKALDEMADEIAEKVKPVLGDVEEIITYLNDPNGDIKQSMKHFNQLAQNLEQTRKRADSLLVHADGQVSAVSGKLTTVLDGAADTVQRANSSFSTMEQKLPGIMASAEQSLKNLEKVSGDLKRAEETLLPKIPPLLRKSEDVLSETGTVLGETGTVLRAVKGVWPISSHIQAPQEKQFVPGDSHD